ncbi:hypothetical protein AwDysgo_14230 [Bacteroidales bacterium]|nr:hypothetical protein AwDysgo_14230 [Bacteroidales bacterium]
MGKYLVIIILLLVSFNLYPQTVSDNSDKLVVVWTNDNPEQANSVIFMYTHNAKKQGWFNDVTLIIWGASAKLTLNDEKIQAYIEKMKADGVKIEACIACAKMYDAVDKFRELGYDVKGMGVPLTSYLKGGYKVLTF